MKKIETLDDAFIRIAELERENILQRQKEGIALAKKEGKYKGRKRIEIDEKIFNDMIKEWKVGERTASSIYKYFEISPQTFYRRVNEMEKIEADRRSYQPTAFREHFLLVNLEPFLQAFVLAQVQQDFRNIVHFHLGPFEPFEV